jgi:hypothetical protein
MATTHLVYDHRHASFTKSFISQKKSQGYQLVGCEVLYNHYGDRGVVDVVMSKHVSDTKEVEWLICEMKPQLVDIGETVRQVKRAQEYFCKARSDMVVKDCVNRYRFLLVLEANDHNLMQALKYREIFQGIEVLYHHEDLVVKNRIMAVSEIENAVVNLCTESSAA